MSALRDAKKQILTDLKAAIGKEYTPTLEELQIPRDLSRGDLAFACFALAKGLKRNPAELASELAAKIAPKGFVKSLTAAGPYVNFTLDHTTFGTKLLESIAEQGAEYGMGTTGAGKRVMVEFANPNTHKEVHVGHLRNFFVGQTVVNLLKANGYDVVPVSYINDLGAHVAACLWAVENHTEAAQAKDEDTVTYLSRMYVAATKAAEEDPKVKEHISAIHRELEALKGPHLKLWKKTRAASLKALQAVFKELRLTLDKTYYESELIAEARALIEQLIEKGTVTHSEGAWIVNLEAEKLGVNLLVKSDGTLLYNAKDLALAMRKEEEYHPVRSLYVIDARQSLAMQQLFATLRRMGFTRELDHISYDFVTLKEGAMSSRKGNVIRYETLRDAARDLARAETRKRHEDWSDRAVEKTARIVADAALRFGMLKQDPDKKIVFDMQEAVSFEGFTGPYLLYTNARINSILKKAGRQKPVMLGERLSHPAEHRLLLHLSRFPDTVFESGSTYHLSAVAQYLFELCQLFASFYEAVPVLQAENADVIRARLGLISGVRQTLENGLQLLGIESITEM